MSAHREFSQAQERLNALFNLGHLLTSDNVEFIIHELGVHINQMVFYNRVEYNRLEYNHSIVEAVQAALTPTPTLSTVTLPSRSVLPVAAQPIRHNPLEKIKVISKKKLDESCPQECAVCQDTPNYKDAVCTECNHYYCKPCWSNWMNSNGSNKKCPTCRKDMPKTTTFRARASNQRRLIVV